MRPLVIDEQVKVKIAKFVEWANQPGNWYRPTASNTEPPGDNPAYVLMLEHGFRCVYSMTVMPDGRYRHLSISVEGSKWPNELAAFTIAAMFGFTGGTWAGPDRVVIERPGSDWQMALDEPNRAVILAQRM